MQVCKYVGRYVLKFKFQAGRFHCNYLTSAIAIPLEGESCKIKNLEQVVPCIMLTC